MANIKLTNSEIHLAISRYIKDKYDVDVTESTVNMGLNSSARPELRGATVTVQLKPKQ